MHLSAGLNCGGLRRDPECLDVYTHSPRTLPKCYCTALCEERLEDLAVNCSSGQLLADGCGHCLICARARGQSCGGTFNVLGIRTIMLNLAEEATRTRI